METRELATEWFVDKRLQTDKDQKYLVEKVYPVLVPALENLLVEAEEQKQITGVETPKEPLPGTREPFDAINWLASWLMRNNPKYSENLKDNEYASTVETLVKRR